LISHTAGSLPLLAEEQGVSGSNLRLEYKQRRSLINTSAFLCESGGGTTFGRSSRPKRAAIVNCCGGWRKLVPALGERNPRDFHSDGPQKPIVLNNPTVLEPSGLTTHPGINRPQRSSDPWPTELAPVLATSSRALPARLDNANSSTHRPSRAS